MNNHKIFKAAIVLVLLMLTGLIRLTHDLLLSIVIGICLFIFAYLIDKGLE